MAVGRRPSGKGDGYDATTLDLARLRNYARKVATECRRTPVAERTRKVVKSVPDTIKRRGGFLGFRTETVRVTRTVNATEQVIGPYWVLRQTNHHVESDERGKATEYHEQNYWVLQADGTLSKMWEWEEFTRWPDGRTRFEQDCTVKPMTEADILRLDYEDSSQDSSGRVDNTTYWGNREPGNRNRHAKGVGLSLALKALLDK